MALTVVTWWWGNKYDEKYVRRLRDGFARNLSEPHRFLVVTDNKIEGIETTLIKDPGLTKHKGCLVRLRMFDDVWQRDIGIAKDDRIVVVDLDVVVTGSLDILFNKASPFNILKGANASNPCPYNGSMWMLRGGYAPQVWDEFTLERLGKIPRHEFPDDQGWMHHLLPNEDGWEVGLRSGIYAFHKPGWPGGDELPDGARLIVFPGKRDPSQFEHLSWVTDHWR